MATVNYAQNYSSALAQAYPNVLRFGRLWSTENTAKYRVVDAKTIQIPSITTTGRVNGDRDTIGGFTRRHDNSWETKELKNHREWDTFIHPQDVNQSNMVMSIQNATKDMNEMHKFPEMDAYLISEVFKAKNALETVTNTLTAIDVAKVLDMFDKLMDEMDEENVPAIGRLLYVPTDIKTIFDNALINTRMNGDTSISRIATRINEVEIIGVPSKLMKTAYDFAIGYAPASSAKDIAMFLVHPSAVLPIVSYAFSQMEAPSATTKGKYVYFEESFEDVFILNNRQHAVKFALKPSATRAKEEVEKEEIDIP